MLVPWCLCASLTVNGCEFATTSGTIITPSNGNNTGNSVIASRPPPKKKRFRRHFSCVCAAQKWATLFPVFCIRRIRARCEHHTLCTLKQHSYNNICHQLPMWDFSCYACVSVYYVCVRARTRLIYRRGRPHRFVINVSSINIYLLRAIFFSFAFCRVKFSIMSPGGGLWPKVIDGNRECH